MAESPNLRDLSTSFVETHVDYRDTIPLIKSVSRILYNIDHEILVLGVLIRQVARWVEPIEDQEPDSGGPDEASTKENRDRQSSLLKDFERLKICKRLQKHADALDKALSSYLHQLSPLRDDLHRRRPVRRSSSGRGDYWTDLSRAMSRVSTGVFTDSANLVAQEIRKLHFAITCLLSIISLAEQQDRLEEKWSRNVKITDDDLKEVEILRNEVESTRNVGVRIGNECLAMHEDGKVSRSLRRLYKEENDVLPVVVELADARIDTKKRHGRKHRHPRNDRREHGDRRPTIKLPPYLTEILAESWLENYLAIEFESTRQP
ncbi:hypothetical protein P152DRAFT_513853 [Eremomyces bilateralis CBS 781.70]|uniref:Uncharacterized protein n=1 Tax=Eremomyces bilateralis CBS 781.70 TaxID=1392243 RepID=A0A6G1G4Q8_9PEZI|nr:uncharacterized protein P152DRAFT_513853 [Eremomyces bilateralis CBS 781.70]KAF1812819.1 hypothetical protein P152DRAFT_513853 [Eremomyces bilateralis CBS 781.70]